jgi:hypothetical protein
MIFDSFNPSLVFPEHETSRASKLRGKEIRKSICEQKLTLLFFSDIFRWF